MGKEKCTCGKTPPENCLLHGFREVPVSKITEDTKKLIKQYPLTMEDVFYLPPNNSEEKIFSIATRFAKENLTRAEMASMIEETYNSINRHAIAIESMAKTVCHKFRKAQASTPDKDGWAVVQNAQMEVTSAINELEKRLNENNSSRS